MNYNLFFHQLDKLRDVPRFSTYPLYKENVAEHSYYVALITMVIARQLKAQGVDIDTGKALSFALMHDAEESITGDVILSTKQLMPDYNNIVAKPVYDWLEEVYAGYCDGSVGKTFGLWRWAKYENTIEGRVVAYADQLA